MDETALRLDAPCSYSYAERGSQRVVADTTGHEAVRVSIALCASASGKKLPVLVIIPRATPLPGFVPPDNVILLYRTASTFNGEKVTIQNIPARLTNVLQPADVVWIKPFKSAFWLVVL